mmetsp:Transcript_31346/g.67666  ORF Transcript_31346/g.67666 Transcript_31346/m.67666 type:complete len:179 (-) Transcript_31346:1400-1936(-)
MASDRRGKFGRGPVVNKESEELAHFWKFKLVEAVLPHIQFLITNTNSEATQASDDVYIHEADIAFSAVYMHLLQVIEAMYRGGETPELRRGGLFASMKNLLGPIAQIMMQENVQGGVAPAPTWRYIPFVPDRPVVEQVVGRINSAKAAYKAKHGVDDDNNPWTALSEQAQQLWDPSAQ